jgi:thioredoxin-like negative regulator of GroEL
MDLEDCSTKDITDIGKDKEAQAKYKIAVIPTIILFKDGEEVARFQADLSFKMVATKEEVQEEIDNQLMSDF